MLEQGPVGTRSSNPEGLRPPTRVACPPVGWLRRSVDGFRPTGFMGLAFMGAGLLVWLLFWYADSEPPQGLRKWGSASFAALFFVSGVFLARVGFGTPRFWAERRFHGGREAWGQGYRWSPASHPLPRRQGLGLLEKSLGLLMLVGLAGVSNLVWADLDAVQGSLVVVYLVVPALSLFMLLFAAYGFWGIAVTLLQGRSTLRLDPDGFPARLGTTLRADYERGQRQPAMNAAIAALACLEFEDAGGRQPADARLLYHESRPFDLVVRADGRRRARIEFAIPADAPPTDLARAQGRRVWFLDIADRDAAGTRAEAPETFVVPVY